MNRQIVKLKPTGTTRISSNIEIPEDFMNFRPMEIAIPVKQKPQIKVSTYTKPKSNKNQDELF